MLTISALVTMHRDFDWCDRCTEVGMCVWSPSMYKQGDRVRVAQDNRGIVDTSLLDEEGVVVSLDPRIHVHSFWVYEVRLDRLSVTSTYYFNEFNLARCAGTGRSPPA